MPQLNPTPWFTIFLLTWFTLMLFSTKILNTKPKPLTPSYSKNLPNHNWTWPWS
uniref:ATP synthase complex subunit 8 n=1 Tax=Takydromus kuehnei TaxID=118846 RepID=A0A8K1JHF7_9SAUR|nr:ATP synthase F0 subunit 8 [Takydromus kuehnei]